MLYVTAPFSLTSLIGFAARVLVKSCKVLLTEMFTGSSTLTGKQWLLTLADRSRNIVR